MKILKLNPTEFLKNTTFFNLEQSGLLIKLICVQFQSNGKVAKNDFDAICDSVKGSELVKRLFDSDEEGYWYKHLEKPLESKPKVAAKEKVVGVNPSIEEIENYLDEINLDKGIAKKVQNHYLQDGKGFWVNSNGKIVVNWKTTIQNNWDKPEYKKRVSSLILPAVGSGAWKFIKWWEKEILGIDVEGIDDEHKYDSWRGVFSELSHTPNYSGEILRKVALFAKNDPYWSRYISSPHFLVEKKKGTLGFHSIKIAMEAKERNTNTNNNLSERTYERE